MYSPLSSDWEFTVRNGGVRKTVADLYASSASSAPLLTDLPVVDFSISCDRRAKIRRSGTITLDHPELLQEIIESQGTGSFGPYGIEIRLRTGYVHAGGTTELVPVGVFQVEEIRWGEPKTVMTMDVVDRSRIHERKLFYRPYPAAGFTALELITLLVEESPWTVVVDPAVVDVELPGGTFYTGDHLEFFHTACEAMGAEFYYDTVGTARIRPVPYVDQSTTPSGAAWQIDVGDQGVLISVDRSMSRRDTVNQVHVFGNMTSDQPIPWARVSDDSPASPTYINGPFGRSDITTERQELTTYQQCQVAALAILQNSKGLAANVTVKTLGNPALEEGDTVAVTYLDGSQEVHIVDAFTLDNTGAMDLVTRAQIRV